MVTDSGNGWTVEVDDSVMIWEFQSDMELAAFREEAYSTFEDLLQRHTFNGMVTNVKLDDPFTKETFQVWEQSAQRADQEGIERWAVVADGIKAISLRGKVDTGGLEVLTSEDRTKAVEWAR